MDLHEENKHYAVIGIQPIEFFQSICQANPKLTAFEGSCIKDIIKYVARYGLKDEKKKEAGKVLDYALWLYLDAMGVEINPRKHNHRAIMEQCYDNARID